MSKRRPLVYISGPISSSGNLFKNLHTGILLWRDLVRRGYAPVCPHMNDLGYIVTGDPVSWEDALECDEEILLRCDAVYRIAGYSRGAKRECALAAKNGIPVARSVSQLRRMTHAKRQVPPGR